jgi:transcriptional regulator GlxA family with amidase domain
MPGVGRALALLHKQPSHPWTIASLADEVGPSRSVLAERFRHYLSDTQIGYLPRWRLQLAAQVLTSTSKSVDEVVGDVEYESEPSFNRAFKREFGVLPARFRSQTRHSNVRINRVVMEAKPDIRITEICLSYRYIKEHP